MINPSDFSSNAPGRLVRVSIPDDGWAFLPNSLPPTFIYTEELVRLLGDARSALGKLDGIGTRLPNPALFVRPYLQREAIASSKIEGTYTDSGTLFRHEAAEETPKNLADVQEVINYIKALNHAARRLRTFPLSLRLMKEVHAHLMRGVRGKDKAPGEFRREQNWIGGISFKDARFVPPPAAQEPVLSEMGKALDAWEKFMHGPCALDPLLQCAMLHYQFETIHPFKDGNGRVGRIMCILFLLERKILSRPLLYLSAYFERHRTDYYDLLLGISQKGDWEKWFSFFLKGVCEQAEDAVQRASALFAWRDEARRSLPTKKRTFSPRVLLDALLENPYLTVPRAEKFLRTTYPTAKLAVQHLLRAGVVEEVPRGRPRLFLCKRVMEIFAD